MRLVVAGVLLLNIGTVVGCSFFYLDIFTCPDPDHGHLDSRGDPDPCHERDPDAGTDAGEVDAAEAGVANAGCAYPYECIPPGPYGWEYFPWLTWIGPKGQAPGCPEHASEPVKYNGYAGLVTPEPACAGCTCVPSTGSCKIPSGFKAHAAPFCTAQGTETSFPAPSGWDGTCNQDSPIDAGAMCGTPAVPCVQSISIDKLTIETESCAVGTGTAPVTPYFGLEAYPCIVANQGGCDDGSYMCIPASDPLPGGFRLCIHTENDMTGEVCPSHYPAGPYVFYQGMTDARVCNCTCGDPVGSKCTALMSVYEDDACTQPAFLSVMIDSSNPNPECNNVPSGVAVGSKEITDPIYHPGTCDPKGEPAGEVELKEPMWFCCTAANATP